MRILLSNDDGIDAPGLQALERHLASLGEVWVVAPETQQSAKSHALTMHKSIRISERGERRFAVGGTPVDSVYVARHHILPKLPDLVVSGINRGANIGEDVHYSGTVAAAREGVLLGIHAMAVSLHVDFGKNNSTLHWDTAGALAYKLAADVLERGLPQGCLLNLNVPNVPATSLRGVKACALGHHFYDPLVEEREDPRGSRYFWLGGSHANFGPQSPSEGHFVEEGWASLVPLTVDVTARHVLGELASWDAVDSVHSE